MDILGVLEPVEVLKLRLRCLYESRGYKKYEMRKFEEYSFYLENRSFLVSDSVITFTDLDGRLLALKPDVTLSIAKNADGGDRRLYYTENVYRPDRAGLGFVEIEQVGLERMGRIDGEAVCEAVSLAGKSLRLVSESSLLELSHCGFLNALLSAVTGDKALRAELTELISRKNAQGIERLAQSASLDAEKARALRFAASACGDCEKVVRDAGGIWMNDEMRAALAELSGLCRALKAESGLCDVRIDLSLHGEEGYYNGIVFCGYVEGLPFRVLSGGRYDALLGRLGKAGGAVGFALYFDGLRQLYGTEKQSGSGASAFGSGASVFGGGASAKGV